MKPLLNIRVGRPGKRIAIAITALLLLLLLIYRFPYPFFAYERDYRGFAISSDRPIPPTMDRIIDDAIRRLSTSPLYHRGDTFRVFICNDNWRLKFFAFSDGIGGQTIYLTDNIFIRKADIAGNRIYSPGPEPLLDAADRPLSYFIAHEAAHVMQRRHFGLLKIAQTPKWLEDGHADLVAKAGVFDLAENQRLMRSGDLLLSREMARNGLYRRYHVMVLAQMLQSKRSIDQLFADPPTEQSVEALALSR